MCKGATFPLVSLVGVATGLGCGGVKVLDAGAVALVVVARCSWAEPVAWCCPVTMAVWAAWWQGRRADIQDLDTPSPETRRYHNQREE